MRTRRRVRRPLLALAAAASLLALGGVGGGAPAQAQDAAPTGETLFGNYDLQARGLGVQARYEIEGLLPGGSPVLDLTVPESLAKFSSGPTGYGLASVAYPGGLIVNLGSLIAQAGAGVDPTLVPDYPLKAETFFPSGPLSTQSQAIGTQSARSTNLGVEALGTYPGVDAEPVIKVDSITSNSRASIEDGKAVSRTRVVLGGVHLLGGVITIDALETDLVAAHDGTTGTTAGGTKATGVRFLGLAAELSEDGLVLDDAPAATGPAAPLGTLLNPILDPLAPLTGPVKDLVKGVLDQAVPSLDDVLAAAGIQLELLGGGPVTLDSGASAFQSSGLALTFSYKGSEQAELGQLIESIPPELRPNLGPLPNPISFLVNNHITGLTLGSGSVSALAAPPFDSDLGGGDVDFGELPSFTDGGTDFGSPGFETPVPDVGGSNGTGDLGGAISAIGSGAIPAIALLLLVAGAGFMGIATTRLADNVLAPVSTTSCPSGLDQPPAPPRDP
jgi:hypothetical protein